MALTNAKRSPQQYGAYIEKVSLGVRVWHGNRFDLHKSEMPANVYTWFDCGDAHHVMDIYVCVRVVVQVEHCLRGRREETLG